MARTPLYILQGSNHQSNIKGVNMKRIALIAIIASSFTGVNALADNALFTTTPSVTNTNPAYKDGAVPGQLGYDVDHNGLVDKINTVDVLTSNAWEEGKQGWDSATRAHERLDHVDDRIEAHKKSIGNLYQQKVDVETFKADQERQDKALKNTTDIANSASSYAAEANENAGIAMNMASDASSQAVAANTNATAASDQAMHATKETEKLWQDKASTANVNELRNAHIKETNERIKNDAAESVERINGDQRNEQEINRLDAQKADRADVAELNNRVNASDSKAKSYASQAEKNANAYTDRKVKQVKREERAGVAGAAAMANIPTARELNRLSIGAGTGFYKDTSAVAVGASYRFNARTTVKGSISTTGRDTVAGAGISYEL